MVACAGGLCARAGAVVGYCSPVSVQQILGVLSTDAGQRVAWQATNALREDATLCQCQIHLTHQQNCRLSSPTVVGQLATERASMARYGTWIRVGIVDLIANKPPTSLKA